jgi:DNA-binding LacI/PurR family transcriptional regulator
MVRLKDIAQLAGVSVMTVSKALRDEPDVSAATKAKIKLLAQQTGYVPDSSAQGLRTKTTKLFGLVIPTPTNPVYARIVFAIEERAHELGYDLLIAHTLNKPEREDLCLRRLLSRRVDGLFITPVYRFEAEARIYQEIAVRKIPTVLLGPPAPFCKNFPSIEIEELVSSYNATRHLINLGHKKIAYLTGPPATPWAHERFEGYRRALREAGIEVDDRLVFAAGNTIEDGTKATLQMLNEDIHPTAIQAVSDLVAIGCAETLLAQGVKIPGEISIVGFGNVLTSEYYRVPLTTVRQPKYRLGVAAVEAMMALLRGGQIQTKRLAAELVERKSTAAPRS